MAAIRSHEEWATRLLRERIAAIAARLRGLADDVDRHVSNVDRVGQPGRTSYAQVAQLAQLGVLSGVASMSLGALTTAAYDADHGRFLGATTPDGAS